MDSIAKQPEQRQRLFQEAAVRCGVAVQIIEKDFWVCWTLKRLFELPTLAPNLIFNGGTSLSKVYRIIERFSEDIDISINREYLGFKDETDPLNQRSKGKQKTAVEDLRNACKAKVQQNSSMRR